MILGPQKVTETFLYRKKSNEQVPNKLSKTVMEQAMANYQTAYDLFKNGGLHQ